MLTLELAPSCSWWHLGGQVTTGGRLQSLPRPPSRCPGRPESFSSRAKFGPKATAAPGQREEPWAGRANGPDREFWLISGCAAVLGGLPKILCLNFVLHGRQMALSPLQRAAERKGRGVPGWALRTWLFQSTSLELGVLPTLVSLAYSPVQRNVVRRISSSDTETEVESLGHCSWVTSGRWFPRQPLGPPFPHRVFGITQAGEGPSSSWDSD